VSTFEEYATVTFLPLLSSQLNTTTGIDIVWDDYRHTCL
jgi:hypothetical protein